MRCSRCHREMKAPAVSSGGLSLGPTCARIVGVSMAKQPKAKREHAALVLPGQLKLFEEVHG